MIRILVILLLSSSPALAQVMEDKALQEQLIPESFKLEATAIAEKINQFEWRTTVSYSVTNNSGMNLYAGVLMGSVSVGTCADFRNAHGGLHVLPGPNAIAYAVDPSVGRPRPVYVPAGARVSRHARRRGMRRAQPWLTQGDVFILLDGRPKRIIERHAAIAAFNRRIDSAGARVSEGSFLYSH